MKFDSGHFGPQGQAGHPGTVTRREALRLVAGGAAVLALQACGSDDNPVDDTLEEFVSTPGVHLQHLPSRNMPYTIAIPQGYDPSVATPLILALHYGGTVTPYYGGQYMDLLVGPALAGLGAIMVAPDAVSEGWSNPAAETDVLALVDALNANYNIDAQKTLITGYSMGASGTWYLASRNQNRFKAAIPMAGTPPENVLDIDWTIPIFMIHSRADEVIPFSRAEEAYNGLRDKDVAVEMIAIQELSHYDTGNYVGPLAAAIPWVKDVWGIA